MAYKFIVVGGDLFGNYLKKVRAIYWMFYNLGVVYCDSDGI